MIWCRRGAKGHQTEVLYAEEGQFNPKAARSDRKQVG
jgi:hypothetical protein